MVPMCLGLRAKFCRRLLSTLLDVLEARLSRVLGPRERKRKKKQRKKERKERRESKGVTVEKRLRGLNSNRVILVSCGEQKEKEQKRSQGRTVP